MLDAKDNETANRLSAVEKATKALCDQFRRAIDEMAPVVDFEVRLIRFTSDTVLMSAPMIREIRMSPPHEGARFGYDALTKTVFLSFQEVAPERRNRRG